MLNNEFDRAVKFLLSKPSYAHISSMNQLIFVFFFIFLTSNSTRQLGPDLAFGFVNKSSEYKIRDFKQKKFGIQPFLGSGIHRAGIRNPVLGIRNPQGGIQNPRLSWIPLHGTTNTFCLIAGFS